MKCEAESTVLLQMHYGYGQRSPLTVLEMESGNSNHLEDWRRPSSEFPNWPSGRPKRERERDKEPLKTAAVHVVRSDFRWQHSRAHVRAPPRPSYACVLADIKGHHRACRSRARTPCCLLAVYQLPQRQADVMRLQCVCGGTPSRGEQAASLTSAHLVVAIHPPSCRLVSVRARPPGRFRVSDTHLAVGSPILAVVVG